MTEVTANDNGEKPNLKAEWDNATSFRGRMHRVGKFIRSIPKQLSDLWKGQPGYEELQELILTDPLTGLRNRRAFDEDIKALTHAVLRGHVGEAGYLVRIDLDHFKHVNDTYKHAAGDLALKDFVLLLQTKFRADDEIYRVGGDEFAILGKTDDVQKIIERLKDLQRMLDLRRATAQQSPHQTTGHLEYSFSFGLTGQTKDSLQSSYGVQGESLDVRRGSPLEIRIAAEWDHDADTKADKDKKVRKVVRGSSPSTSPSVDAA